MAVFFPSRHSFKVDMGYTHSEFKRSLPNALNGLVWRDLGNRVEIDTHKKNGLVIELSDQKEATLGTAFTRKYIEVYFSFDESIEVQEIDRFLRDFERFYQKGGG